MGYRMLTDISDKSGEGYRCDWPIVISNVAGAFASKDTTTVQVILELVEGLSKILSSPASRAPAHSESRPAPEKSNAHSPGPQASDAPAVPVEMAVYEDRVICLCCGEAFTMLKRHLRSEHGLTEEAYRKKFSLPDDMPLVAPSYSAKKAEHARASGFGKYDRDV